MIGATAALLGAIAAASAVAALGRSDLLAAREPPAGREKRGLSERGMVIGAAAFAFAAGTLFVGMPVGIVAAVAAVAAPAFIRRRREARSSRQVDEQLADGIAGIAAGMRAGLSLSQAVAFAAKEVEPPLADALAQVVDRESMGMSLSDSLDEWAHSMDGPDFRLAASVLQLHRRTGGDLPMVLDRVAQTLSDRRAAAREARSLTAQARLSGAILGFLPIGFFVFLSVLSPSDMSAAFRSSAGLAAIASGLTMQGAAFLWIRSLLKVEA